MVLWVVGQTLPINIYHLLLQYPKQKLNIAFVLLWIRGKNMDNLVSNSTYKEKMYVYLL